MNPRMEPIRPEDAPAAARPVFDTFMKQRGNVPNMFRTVARRPELMVTLAQHLQAIMSTGTVEPKLKEMLAVRVSQINTCDY